MTYQTHHTAERYTKEFTLKSGATLDVVLDFKPSEIMAYKDYLTCEKDGKLTVGYLVGDSDCANPLEDSDGMGKIYTSHRHSQTQGEMQEALGLDSNWDPNLELIEEESIVAAMHQKLIEQPELLARATEHCDDCFVQSDDETKTTFIFRHLDSVDGLSEAGFDTEIEEVEKALWHEGRARGTIGNKYAVSLDVYEHGGVAYSLSGTGMQCQFDTARGGAVWVPDAAATEEILRRATEAADIKIEVLERACVAVDPKDRKDWKLSVNGHEFPDWGNATLYAMTLADPGVFASAEVVAMREMAKCACEQYTAWSSGDCYGIVTETYLIDLEDIENGNEVSSEDQDAVWGFIEGDYAYRSLKEEFPTEEEKKDGPSV